MNKKTANLCAIVSRLRMHPPAFRAARAPWARRSTKSRGSRRHTGFWPEYLGESRIQAIVHSSLDAGRWSTNDRPSKDLVRHGRSSADSGGFTHAACRVRSSDASRHCEEHIEETLICHCLDLNSELRHADDWPITHALQSWSPRPLSRANRTARASVPAAVLRTGRVPRDRVIPLVVRPDRSPDAVRGAAGEPIGADRGGGRPRVVAHSVPDGIVVGCAGIRGHAVRHLIAGVLADVVERARYRAEQARPESHPRVAGIL